MALSRERSVSPGAPSTVSGQTASSCNMRKTRTVDEPSGQKEQPYANSGWCCPDCKRGRSTRKPCPAFRLGRFLHSSKPEFKPSALRTRPNYLRSACHCEDHDTIKTNLNRHEDAQSSCNLNVEHVEEHSEATGVGARQIDVRERYAPPASASLRESAGRRASTVVHCLAY